MESDSENRRQPELPNDPWEYIRKLEARVQKLEAAKPSDHCGPPTAHPAERIGILGIREIMDSQNRISKSFWVLLFVFGTVATIVFTCTTSLEYLAEPTATKVKLNGSTVYDSPAVAICPAEWIDMEKALALGLALDGLKYSVGYTGSSSYSRLGTADIIAKSRTDFYQFYNSRNFSSLVDFYKAVSIDLETVYGGEEFQRSHMAIKLNDKSKFVGVFFVQYEVCNVYDLLSLRLRLAETSSLRVKLRPKFNGQRSAEAGLWIHFHINRDALISPISFIFLSAFTNSKILVSAVKFSSLSRPDAICQSHHVVGGEYCEYLCVAQCQNRHYKRLFQKQLFRNSLASESLSPWEAWNYLDPPNSTFFSSPESAEIDSICNSECPPPCKKAVYQLSYQWQRSLQRSVANERAFGSANRTFGNESWSYYEVIFDHTAKFSGMTTFVELPTYSFTELVTSVGGTLGLFLGASLMTCVQLIWFLIECTLRRYSLTCNARL